MRISVVTPSFNMARFLGETMASVLVNLQPGDQYLLIDGGSTDGSLDIIRRHEQRLTGWMSEPDRGYADALSKGFARATGDVLCWINAGDLLLPGALDAAREALQDPDAELIFGDDFYIDEDSRVISYSRGYVSDLRAVMLYGGWTPLQDACFWRRGLYDRVGGIDASLRYAADYDLFLRMALQSRPVYIPRAFSAFRRHRGQKSISGVAEYRREREQVRRRELRRAPGTHMGKALLCAWYQGAVRWRVYVSDRRWRRPDLAGRPLREFRCSGYWPPGAR